MAIVRAELLTDGSRRQCEVCGLAPADLYDVEADLYLCDECMCPRPSHGICPACLEWYHPDIWYEEPEEWRERVTREWESPSRICAWCGG